MKNKDNSFWELIIQDLRCTAAWVSKFNVTRHKKCYFYPVNSLFWLSETKHLISCDVIPLHLGTKKILHFTFLIFLKSLYLKSNSISQPLFPLPIYTFISIFHYNFLIYSSPFPTFVIPSLVFLLSLCFSPRLPFPFSSFFAVFP